MVDSIRQDSSFDKKMQELGLDDLRREDIKILQLNVGPRCNLACEHCHLECSPERTEMMSWDTMEQSMELAERLKPEVVDITGGAPELHPKFRDLVRGLCRAGHRVQVRTNLACLYEAGLEDMPEFWDKMGVHLVASLPCYTEENVRGQRGIGTFEKCIAMIQRLNGLGYGIDEKKPLNLVYNPGGPALPPAQDALEQDYHRELEERHHIRFSHLLTITNMPIGRFYQKLRQEGHEEEYLDLLKKSFNPSTVEGLMCRHQICVGWDGKLYDCDFNLALGLPLNHGAPNDLERLKDLTLIRNGQIVTGVHCFGCTAGSGSSCGGSLA
ncbi:MAG: arsenosugar biosynthesis radical SAM (seleno)protein ArsS [Candidatus Sumerlaeia bacterium]